MKIRAGGSWKDADPRVKVGGTWRNVNEGWVKVGGIWKKSYARLPVVTGGTLTSDSTYYYRTFTDIGISTLSITGNSLTVDYLIVGGGGHGGTSGGGGGAGGVLTGTISLFGQYPITVGRGQDYGFEGGYSSERGQPSTAFGFTAIGGGRAAHTLTSPAAPAGSGGSGGGGGGGSSPFIAGAGTPGQGNDGRFHPLPFPIYQNISFYSMYAGGGGGGAGGPAQIGTNSGNGGNYPSAVPGASGVGVTHLGLTVGGGGGAVGLRFDTGTGWYAYNYGAVSAGGGLAGGGSSQGYLNSRVSTAGAPNTGGGGGGSLRAYGSVYGSPGAFERPGGSGVVRIRYLRSAVGG